MKLLSRMLLAVLASAVLLLAWGLAEPYFIDEEAHGAVIANLPVAWEGERIALIADLQVGMWLGNTLTIERIVERLVEERPAVVLIAGDFVYHAAADHTRKLQRVVRLLEPLAGAGIPTYAVLGNHDYAMPTKSAQRDEELAEAVARAVEGVGIEVLENEAVTLPAPAGAADGSLYLVGLGAHIPGNDRPAEALDDVPAGAARVVLMHHPNSFASLPADAAPLALAGHTHGGQFRLPFAPDWSWMTYTREDELHADGWIQDYGEAGNRLYVNRGIGFSVVPLRLNCPPELTYFTLASV